MSEAEEGRDRKRAPELMGGLAKGLAIVELFDGTRAQLTAAEAARATGTSRATARRCLLTLEELGYLSRRDGQTFEPCARLARLGRGYRPPPTLAEAAQPILERIRDELQEPAALTVLEGAEVLVLARAEAVRIVATGVRVGGHLPLYCSATGRVLMGDLTEAEARALLAQAGPVPRTPKTCTDPDAILALVAAARRDGVAYSDEEIEIGMRSMAVPVRDGAGRIRASLSLSTSSARVSLAEMQERYFPVLQRQRKYMEDLFD